MAMGLPALTGRDAAAANVAEALDFGKPKKNAPDYRVSSGPFGGLCLAVATSAPKKWNLLKIVAESYGWLVGA